MINGIAVFGPNGAGKSSITHALAKRLAYAELDAEDLYFPEQRASRQKALEGGVDPAGSIDSAWGPGSEKGSDPAGGPDPMAHSGAMPFSRPRTKEEVQSGLLRELDAHPRFILSGVTMNWPEEILAKIGIAFWVQAPLELRLRRIGEREERRFGARVLPGGDMYEQQKAFREMVAGRDPKTIEQTAARLHCPVYPLDGTLPVEENVARILARLGQE